MLAFVALRQPEEIQEVARQVEEEVRAFYSEAEEHFVRRRIVQTTFFKNAPLVFFIFCTEMEYHDPRVTQYYGKRGCSPADMLRELGPARSALRGSGGGKHAAHYPRAGAGRMLDE